MTHTCSSGASMSTCDGAPQLKIAPFVCDTRCKTKDYPTLMTIDEPKQAKKCTT